MRTNDICKTFLAFLCKVKSNPIQVFVLITAWLLKMNFTGFPVTYTTCPIFHVL